jgi:hypothetical protein
MGDSLDVVKRTLRWYWSPYLTTIITAPMFLLLVWLGLHFFRNLIVQMIQTGNFLLGPVSSPFMVIGIGLTWWTLTGIPRIWGRKDWSTGRRAMTIAAVFLGALVAGSILDLLNIMLWSWLRG